MYINISLFFIIIIVFILNEILIRRLNWAIRRNTDYDELYALCFLYVLKLVFLFKILNYVVNKT